jgi:death on curing protein
VLALSDFGGRSGPEREEGLVEQVVAAAFQTFGGVDPHPDPFDKAAMLFRGITQGHPFNDGNKRTGFLVAAYYLHRTGFPLGRQVDEVDIIRLCTRLSAGDLRDVTEVSWALATLWSDSHLGGD